MPKVDLSKNGAAVILSILGLLALSWYWGFEIGEYGVADPDTCWLLAVGRWILNNQKIPASDPFSWTISAAAPTILGLKAASYIPYQWLSSLIFFVVYKNFAARSLLFLVSLLVITAFIVLPTLLAQKLKTPVTLQIIFAALAVSAASFHFPLRPELFSYLLISLLFLLLQPWLLEAEKENCNYVWPFGLGFLLFCLWANLHTGFVVGLIIVIFLTIAAILGRSAVVRLPAFFVGAILGSFMTPFRERLYAYLPDLFFAPINKLNQELMPLSFLDLLSVDYFPFLILQIAFATSIVSVCLNGNVPLLRKFRQELDKRGKSLWLCQSLLTAIAMIAGDNCRRMIPFAVLISLSYFATFGRTILFKGGEKSFWNPPLRFALPLIAAFALWGTQMSAATFVSQIPQTTAGFQPPMQAIAYLKKNRPASNLLNDAQYGDVMIFADGEKAQVFMDTRFDLYGTQICRDYFVMVNALDGWEKLLDRYKIGCVFLPPRARLVNKLMERHDWMATYADPDSIILLRSFQEVSPW